MNEPSKLADAFKKGFDMGYRSAEANHNDAGHVLVPIWVCSAALVAAFMFGVWVGAQ